MFRVLYNFGIVATRYIAARSRGDHSHAGVVRLITMRVRRAKRLCKIQNSLSNGVLFHVFCREICFWKTNISRSSAIRRTTWLSGHPWTIITSTIITRLLITTITIMATTTATATTIIICSSSSRRPAPIIIISCYWWTTRKTEARSVRLRPWPVTAAICLVARTLT